MAPINLPYYVPTSELPQPLPTNQEIHDSTEQLMGMGGRRLVRIGPYVVKYGTGVNCIEAENMLFVKANSVTDTRVEMSSYIVMEYLEGHTLDFEWGLLSAQQKDGISDQLRGIERHGLLDCMFWTGDDACAPLSGPFNTENGLNEAMCDKATYNNLSPEKVEFYRRAFPVVLRDHAPVFTHGDFQRKNIIIKRISPSTIREVQSSDPEDDTFELAVIDWENAGWYPNYWEFAIALFACGSWKDDWHKWVGRSLDLFLNEFVWMQMLRSELWS
ncbi:hypothetical protein LSUB1_G008439 [Lachnellula subtilissima]|uniref:Aminoglycoside phosphotransferase domain-containing protein n=1 Tax=Lachnellula subtilissima TaxID=602034 RepID=A0A8H8RF45_9HELO|nr:hypothetical protein LSUB1_G008439 [Lachnellula subtilissima]